MQTEVPLLFSKLQTSCSAITLPPLSSLKANQSLLCVEDLLSGLRRQQKKTLRSFFFEPVVGFCSRKKNTGVAVLDQSIDSSSSVSCL